MELWASFCAFLDLPSQFWAVAPKGTIFYRTKGVNSVLPSVLSYIRLYICTSVRPPSQGASRGFAGLREPQKALGGTLRAIDDLREPQRASASLSEPPGDSEIRGCEGLGRSLRT